MSRKTGDKARVGILFADATERARCAEYVEALGHKALVSTPAKARFEEWTDLSVLIADASAAETRRTDLKVLKDRNTADFRYLPRVIALPIRADFAPWFSFGFDDVLRTPIQREALRVRIEIWLRLQEEAERHYRSLVEGGAIGIYRTTPDGRILYANPALARMLGFASFEELRDRNLEEEGFESAQVRARFRERIERDGRVTGWEATWTRADGTPLHVRESAQVVCDATGRVLYYEGTVEDIAAEKRAERQSQAREATYRTVVENIPQKIFVKGRDLRYLTINNLFARDLGQDPEEIVGKVDSDLFPKDLADKYRADDERIMKTGVKEEFDEEYVEEGVRRIVHTIKTPIRDEVGTATGVLGVFWDVTEERRFQEALRRHTQELAVRNAIAEILLSVPDEDMYPLVLQVVLDAMQSPYGVFGYINDAGDLVVPTMTRMVWDVCQVADKRVVFSRESWGEQLCWESR